MENKHTLTLGSLFDGSGGFPLGGKLVGIKPIWSSEIEPFPIRVTEKRLPDVQHFGDVSKLDGAKLPPVDIITFGSPCQDMSVAGKREGLSGSRSNLFYQAIRIIKEMRNATNGKYPRFIVWENVPGAFSSNGGEDFKAVLEEICKIKDSRIALPRPDRWSNAGEILADDYSVAWRVLDAQYWGVPQRRKRIYLVADFADRCAEKILFESEGVSGYSAKSVCKGQGTTRTAESGADTASGMCLNDQGGNRIDITNEKTCTLRAEAHHPPCVMESAGFCTEHSAKSRSIGYEEERSPTLRSGVVPAVFENHSQDTRYTGPLENAPTVISTYGTGGNNQPFVVDTPKAYGVCSKDSNSMKSDNPNSGFYEADTSRTLDANGGNPSCNQGGMAVVCVDMGGGKSSCCVSEEKAPTLACTHGGEPAVCVQGSMIGRTDNTGPRGSGVNEDVSFTLNTTDKHAVAYGIDRAAFNQGRNAKYGLMVEDEVEPTMVARGANAVAQPTYSSSKASFFTNAKEEIANTLVATDYKDPPLINDRQNTKYIVRRLTPTECAQLQGFPDDWCANLGDDNPTNEEIDKWKGIFDEYNKAIGKNAKPKTDRQIIKWLKNPHSDSAEYKMWGNGVALPCVCFVLAGITYFATNA